MKDINIINKYINVEKIENDIEKKIDNIQQYLNNLSEISLNNLMNLIIENQINYPKDDFKFYFIIKENKIMIRADRILSITSSILNSKIIEVKEYFQKYREINFLEFLNKFNLFVESIKNYIVTNDINKIENKYNDIFKNFIIEK